MKKLAVGCLVVVALGLVAGGVGMYWVYQKAKTTIEGFDEIAKIPEIDRSLENTAAFVPPASGELTEETVVRYVAVQEAVRTRLGARFNELQQKYKSMLERKGEATVMDLPQLIAAYRDLAGAFVDARRAQVEAMNAQRFSRDEYDWTRRQVYTAIGVPIMTADVAEIVEAIASGRQPEEPSFSPTVGPQGPERNQKLVEPHRDTLVDNAALTLFGL